MIRHSISLVTLLFGTLCGATGSAHADTILGRWCDRMIPNMPAMNQRITIIVESNGNIIMQRKFGDGSSGKRNLKELGGGIFAVVGSRTGDKYRVVPSTGELQMLDNDGLIRTARRLENKPTPGECR